MPQAASSSIAWPPSTSRTSEKVSSANRVPEAAGAHGAQPCRFECGRMLLESLERLDQAIDGLFREPHAGRRYPAAEWHDGFRGAAAAQRDDRSAAGLGLDGDDAEVFFTWEDQRPATPQMVAQYLIRLPSKKIGVRPAAHVQLPSS